MPILKSPAELSDWRSGSDGDLITAHQELAQVSPGLRPSSGANLTTVELLIKEAPDLDPLSVFFEASNPWEETLRDLRSAQDELVTKHWIERNIVTGPLDAMIYGLSLVPRLTPMEGTAIYAATKLLEGQRAILEHGVLQVQAKKRAALARHAIRRLMMEDDRPYGMLFPIGDPERVKANIKRAQALLRDDFSDLDPDMREEVLHGMLDAMTSLVEANPAANAEETPEDLNQPYDAQEAKQVAKDAQLATKAARAVIEQKKRDMQASVDLSAKLVKIIVRLEAQGQLKPSDQERIKQLGKDITAATGAAQSVVSAAEALGLPADTAADLNKAVAIVSNAAMLYVGIKTNPAQAITAAANLITLFAGRKRKDPAAARHKAVMNALSTIFKQNQQIMENQRVIFDSLDRLSDSVYAIQRNQAALFGLGLATLDAVLLNRGLIVRATTGPIALLEDAVAEFERLRGSNGVTYDMLQTFFSGYTGDVTRGLSSLRTVLRPLSQIHPVLLQTTYRDGARAEIQTEGHVNYFEVGSSASGKLRDEDERRYTLCRTAWMHGGTKRDPRILTEFGTYCSVYDQTQLGKLDLGLKHTWDGTLPPSLLEIGLVWRLGTLALRSHQFHQFLSELTGSPSLRPLNDIQNQPAQNNLGRYLLEKALSHVDCALAQSYLMTGRFASIDYLLALQSGKNGAMGRTMIELDRYGPEHPMASVNSISYEFAPALWSTVLENDEIKLDTSWIDRFYEILPQFSDAEAVKQAMEKYYGLQGSIDGFMYTLSGEDQALVDEYFEVTDQAYSELQKISSEFFQGSGVIELEFTHSYKDVAVSLKSVSMSLADLPNDIRAIAEGIGGLVDDGRLEIDAEKIIEGRDAEYFRDGIAELAEHFVTMGNARKLGVDHPSLSDKVPDAMRALSLYSNLSEDRFRGGTAELRALRAALIGALAEYDISDEVLNARKKLNVAVALSAADLKLKPIEET